MLAAEELIDVQRAVAIHAVKAEIDPLAPCLLGQGKVVAIPRHACGKRAAAGVHTVKVFHGGDVAGVADKAIAGAAELALNHKIVGQVDLAVMDVSFISQTYILPRIPAVLRQGGRALTLIKPQFEAGRGALNKNGLVKHPRDRIAAVRRVLNAAAQAGLVCRGLAPSPILGGDGNEEYLVYFTVGEDTEKNAAWPVEKTVLEGVSVI